MNTQQSNSSVIRSSNKEKIIDLPKAINNPDKQNLAN